MRNRNASAKTSKDIWEQACDFFEVMLDDFRSKNLLRKSIKKSDREKLNLLWENSRNYQNALNDMIRRRDLAQKWVDAGLSKQTARYLMLSQLIGNYLIELEAVFRASLLFFLREEHGFRKRMTLTQLLKTVKEISPSIGTELYSLIDTRLRNCLAHGTFWFKKGAGGRIFLAINSHLEEVREI